MSLGRCFVLRALTDAPASIHKPLPQQVSKMSNKSVCLIISRRPHRHCFKSVYAEARMIGLETRMKVTARFCQPNLSDGEPLGLIRLKADLRCLGGGDGGQPPDE
ncbi:hypothetical protein NW759_009301 [Fusarium solani]|nr:hypothetical protein NW759_009301 [Fusarium solani]